jgi:hypothetical protein
MFSSVPTMTSHRSLIFFRNIEICFITMSTNMDEKTLPRFGALVGRSAVKFSCRLVASTKGIPDHQWKTSS